MQEMTKRFILHIYILGGDPLTQNYDYKELAIQAGNNLFKTHSVYKIKLWDMEKGEIERNNPNAKALIKEWI